jgi:hypothetical protein
MESILNHLIYLYTQNLIDTIVEMERNFSDK